MVRKQEFSILLLSVTLYSLVYMWACILAIFLYLHLNAVMHTDHWIIILYNCCIPRYYSCRMLYGSELYYIVNNIPKNSIYRLLALSPTEYYLDSYTMLQRNLDGFVRRLLSVYIDFCIPLKMASKSTVDTPSRFAIEISDCDLQRVHFWPFLPTTSSNPQDSTKHFKRAGSVMLNTATITTPKVVNWKILKPCLSIILATVHTHTSDLKCFSASEFLICKSDIELQFSLLFGIGHLYATAIMCCHGHHS